MTRLLVVAMVAWLAVGLGVALAADEGKAPTTAPAADGKIVNAKCPITGKAFDPAKVPAERTREFKGQKVGFCCPMCPPAWDKLSDADKEAKLAEAMKPEPPKADK